MKKGVSMNIEDEFQNFLKAGELSFMVIVHALFQMPLNIIESVIRNISGPVGFLIRKIYYKYRLAELGTNCLIDIGVIFINPKNVSVKDFSWIDSYCIINAQLGKIEIGSRVHIAPFTVIAGRERIKIGDYVGIASGVKIYSNSVKLDGDKLMCGPMVPNEVKANYSREIVIENHVFIGANALILPGAHLQYGCVVPAGSIISKTVRELEIVAKNGAFLKKRQPPNEEFEIKID